jgi:spore coat protein U-like protein
VTAVVLLLGSGATGLRADPMNVTATVLEVCELGTISDMAFGNLTPGTNLDVSTTAAIQWRCSNGTSADITINDGNNSNRTMDGPGTAVLAYELYKDAGLAERWGDTGTETVTVSGTGMASFSSVTVHGEVLHADYVNVAQGPYSDVVTVDVVIN